MINVPILWIDLRWFWATLNNNFFLARIIPRHFLIRWGFNFIQKIKEIRIIVIPILVNLITLLLILNLVKAFFDNICDLGLKVWIFKLFVYFSLEFLISELYFRELLNYIYFHLLRHLWKEVSNNTIVYIIIFGVTLDELFWWCII